MAIRPRNVEATFEITGEGMMKFRAILMGGAAAAAVLTSAEASAQTAEGTTIGEVVVTARRVEENIQAVPVSITVATGDRLVGSGNYYPVAFNLAVHENLAMV